MRLLFTCLFLLASFFSPSLISAQTPTVEPPPSGQDVIDFSKEIQYVTKDYNIDPKTVHNRDTLTNYNQKDKDITFRAINDQNRDKEKGFYIKQVLEGKYTDKILAYTCQNSCYSVETEPDNCEPVKISTLAYAYHHYNPNTIIIYDENGNPLDYNPSTFSGNYTIISDKSCYTNLYDGLQIVPQGAVGNIFNAAAVSSKQLNNSLKTPISQDTQEINQANDPEPTSFWDQILIFLGIKIDANKRQEGYMTSQFIPEKEKTAIGSDPKNKAKRTKFTEYMHPYSWQKSPPNRGSSSNGGGHAQGLSQYGAQGRALAGQNYQDILTAYYGSNTSLVTMNPINPMIEIKTPSGNQSMEFETTYLLGIAEMPDSWNIEALKAQAVAARTYAYVYTNNFTKPICIDTHCQVYAPEHIALSPNWKQAVEATAGQILVDSTTQKPFLTMYSAWNGGASIVYSDSGHTTVSINDSDFEKAANAPY